MTTNVLQFGVRARGIERRHYPRVRVTGIQAAPSSGGLLIVNMSRRGMAILAPHPFSVGGTYLFELAEGHRSLLVEGQVQWSIQTAEATTVPAFRSGVAFVGVRRRDSGSTTGHLSPLPPVSSDVETDGEELVAARTARLETATSANEAAEALLDLLSSDFEHLVLLRVLEGTLRAWMGRGPRLVPERLRSLSLPLDRVSMLRHLEEGGRLFCGALAAICPHLETLRCWQGSRRQECALAPVRIGKRLVAVLYVDAGDEGFPPPLLDNLEQATGLFSRSLTQQILRRKAAAASSPS